jgi:hypothetical protein
MLAALTALTVVGAAPTAASAAEPEPHLRVFPRIPDHVTPGQNMTVTIAIENSGDAPLSGNLTINYSFPSEVKVSQIEAQLGAGPALTCVPSGAKEECTLDATGVPSGQIIVYQAFGSVEPTATGILTGQVEVSGGGAPNTETVPFALDTAPIGPFEIKAFDVAMTDGPVFPATQAGGHPAAVATSIDEFTSMSFLLGLPGFGSVAPSENFRDVITHVPVGFVGNPTATGDKCTAAEIATHSPNGQYPICPRDSQIGTVLINGTSVAPLYNMVPAPGVPAEFAIYYQGLIINLQAKLRPSDNGVDIVSTRSVSSAPLPTLEINLWGTPADSSHDNLRAECTFGVLGNNGELCPSQAPKTPFLRQPTSCTGPLPWSIEMDTYQHPGVFHSKSTTTPALTGCDAVPFESKVSVAPTDSAAHSTSGLDVALSLPQGSGPDGISSADVRSAAVSLPEGVSLNPAAAEGLEACSDAQLRLGLEGPAQCPEASKLGTVQVDTPLLEQPLDGSVYLRTQNSQDPESGEMYRLAIVLHSEERGVDVKLPGSLVVNKTTGQLTTTFSELPQLPFEAMQLHLKAGPRAPLSTPQACGTYTSQATLSGWNGKTVSLAPSFSVNQDCTAPGFAPGFQAGVADPSAGEFSPFTLRVTRDSGQPNLSRIEATLPEGELAKLAGVPLCSDAQAATGACPAQSRIGKLTSAVGEGTSPIYLPQPGKAPSALYLAGPYKGAPYSALAAVPAQSGPFDLGTVLVRSALRIDPETAQASVVSDPLPQIFGGILVSYRDVRVEVDRPEFTVNPTSCEPKSVTGRIGAASGASANVSARFQVSDCAALAFKPKLALRLKGKTGRGGHPALRATLTMPKGGANVDRASVALPHSEFLAQSHIRTVCTRVQFNAGSGGGAQCPKGSIYGRATAVSPLLDKPLSGPVYLRSSSNPLPDLVAALDGQIHVDLVGRIDSVNGGIRTTFANVPDAPVSKFVLSMQGGKKGLLENSTDICAATNRVTAKFDGQNGKIGDSNPPLKADCGAKKGKRK